MLSNQIKTNYNVTPPTLIALDFIRKLAMTVIDLRSFFYSRKAKKAFGNSYIRESLDLN